MRSTVVVIGAMAVLLTSASSAQERPDVTGPVLECRAIQKKSARLECYDNALDSAFGKDEEIEERREQSFGIRDASQDDEGTLDSVIASVSLDQSLGLATIRLENGQIWRTTSNGTLLYRLREGQKATIAPSRISGYRLRIEGLKGYQGVKRQR